MASADIIRFITTELEAMGFLVLGNPSESETHYYCLPGYEADLLIVAGDDARNHLDPEYVSEVELIVDEDRREGVHLSTVEFIAISTTEINSEGAIRERVRSAEQKYRDRRQSYKRTC
jgi:hypothetical protein